MHRREWLRLAGVATALSWLPPETDLVALAHRVRARGSGRLLVLTSAQAGSLTLLSETIIPRTDTPGASDVGVVEFIDHLLAGWYPDEEAATLVAGLAAIEQAAAERFGRPLDQLASPELATFLTDLEGQSGDPGTAPWALKQVKSLTVYGYFTSERVMKEVTKVQVIPGRAEGCIHV